MVMPKVTEIRRPLEAVTPDPFLDRTWRIEREPIESTPWITRGLRPPGSRPPDVAGPRSEPTHG